MQAVQEDSLGTLARPAYVAFGRKPQFDCIREQVAWMPHPVGRSFQSVGAFMWPWQAFDWGVFWAIIAAVLVCWIGRDLIMVIVAYLRD